MKQISDEQVKVIRDAFGNIDFDLPGAHVCFREMNEAVMNLDVSDSFSWRDHFFFTLGLAVAENQAKFNTIPPVSVHKEEKTTEGQ